MAVKHEVHEESLASAVPVTSIQAGTLGELQKQKIRCKEEVLQLETAMTIQIQMYDGLFKCGARAVGAYKRARKELQKVKRTGCSDVEFAKLATNEAKCITNVRQLAECCKTSAKAMALLETRYNLEVEVCKKVDIEIAELRTTTSVVYRDEMTVTGRDVTDPPITTQ
jgi:hypothetical protein